MIAIVMPCPVDPALYSGGRLYEFCIDVEVKQRRPTAKQFASVGGVVLPLRYWKSETAGAGAGSAAAAAIIVPAGTTPNDAAPAKAMAATLRATRHVCLWNTLSSIRRLWRAMVGLMLDTRTVRDKTYA
jgi:hypothetical protein